MVSPVQFPTLKAGSGWSSVTPELAPVGSPSAPGYDARAIARWNVVPFQDVDEPMTVGVVAFHTNGIERVEFSLEGGPWIPVTEKHYNTRTQTWEYAATFDPSEVDDGLAELRARVIPRIGTPRILQGPVRRTESRDGVWSMFLNSNAGGTLIRTARYVSPTGSDSNDGQTPQTPVRTMAMAARQIHLAQGGLADGGVIYLMEGDHTMGPGRLDEHGNFIGLAETSTRWLNVTRAPGTDPDQVRITRGASGGIRTSLVRVHDLTVRQYEAGAIFVTSANDHETHHLWLDNLDMTGPGRAQANGQRWTGSRFDVVFATNIEIRDAMNGFRGENAMFQRNVHLEDIGASAFHSGSFIVNCSVTNLTSQGNQWGWHPHVWLLYTPSNILDNHIIYGLKAEEIYHPIFMVRNVRGLTNSAVVNLYAVSKIDNSSSTFATREVDHLLLWHNTVLDQAFLFREDEHASHAEGYLAHEMDYRNVSLMGNLFSAFGRPSAMDISGIRAHHNHFIREGTNSQEIGEYATRGDPGLTMMSTGTPDSPDQPAFSRTWLTPTGNSVLLGRTDRKRIPAGLNGRESGSSSAIGAVQP
ncbi:MAG: hypothetical protein EA378_07870 [Phycisphaerales bacterium]|nr:MAG: hypothetical protein EA378_07870 [Phycisphaerales bacterium]